MHGGQVIELPTETLPTNVTTLLAAVDHLDLPVDGRVLTQVLAAVDRLNAKVSTVVGDFDHAQLWDLDAATSMKAWLKHHGHLTNRDANRHTATARRLRTCPLVRQAWTNGTISGGQVAVIVANVNDRTAELFHNAEATIIDAITALSVTDTTLVMKHWAAKAEAVADNDNPPEQPANALHHSHTLNGRSELSGSFNPESATVIDKALDEAMPTYHAEDRQTPSERRAEALLNVMRFYLDHHTQPTGRRNRPHVSFIITEENFTHGGPGHTPEGTVVDHTTIKQMSCDANLHRVLTNTNSAILDYGRSTRTVSPDLYAALTIRDQGCRWPGCDRPPQHTEAHHIQHWQNGGPTRLTNLVLLCSRHHHRLHQPGWSLVLHPDNTVQVTNPNRRVETTHPPPRC